MAQYTPLPSYADDVKEPLLSPTTTESPIHLAEECGNNCERKGFFARMRARCAARRLAKYGPPCENARCQKRQRRRRVVGKIIFSLISLWFIVHLVKGAYMMHTISERVHCQEIDLSASDVTLDLPLRNRMFIDYSLTQADTSIVHSDIPSDTVQVKVQFSNDEEEETWYPMDSDSEFEKRQLPPMSNNDDGEKPKEEAKVLICTAQVHKGVAVGLFPSKKHAELPTVLKTTIVLPNGVDGPGIKFGGKKAGHCIGKMVRKLIKWKGDEIVEKKD